MGDGCGRRVGCCPGLQVGCWLPRRPLSTTCSPPRRGPTSHVAAPLRAPRRRVGPQARARYSLGNKFQLNGVMVATSEPALWGYPQQAGDLMEAAGR